MRKFILKLLLKLVFPLFLLIIALVVWDPFKVFFDYDDYYTTKIVINREHITQKLLSKRTIKPRNFIIGSSRSQAFRVSSWSKRIDRDSLYFYHYDGIGLGLWRSKNALRFIEKETNRIDNLLLIVDSYFFDETQQSLESLKIQPPNVSEQDYFIYYWSFIKKSINLNFVYSYFVHLLTGKYYGFMVKHFLNNKKSHICNAFTNDVQYFNLDSIILADSISYFQKMIKEGDLLWNRNGEDSMGNPKIFYKQFKLLKEINMLLKRNKTNVKIVIGPMFDQVKFNIKDKEILESIFGKTNIYDFSGINEYTQNVGDYYEYLHYRPLLAERILDSVCLNKWYR
jgi:hypothetical protein